MPGSRDQVGEAILHQEAAPGLQEQPAARAVGVKRIVRCPSNFRSAAKHPAERAPAVGLLGHGPAGGEDDALLLAVRYVLLQDAVAVAEAHQAAFGEELGDESLPGTDPDRCCFTIAWRPRDIASHFGDITMETMYRQLSRWAETGLIHKLGPGLYAATAWTSTPLA
ncbi:hypothetical protein [Streptomyces sp. NPDC055287]